MRWNVHSGNGSTSSAPWQHLMLGFFCLFCFVCFFFSSSLSWLRAQWIILFVPGFIFCQMSILNREFRWVPVLRLFWLCRHCSITQARGLLIPTVQVENIVKSHRWKSHLEHWKERKTNTVNSRFIRITSLYVKEKCAGVLSSIKFKITSGHWYVLLRIFTSHRPISDYCVAEKNEIISNFVMSLGIRNIPGCQKIFSKIFKLDNDELIVSSLISFMKLLEFCYIFDPKASVLMLHKPKTAHWLAFKS